MSFHMKRLLKHLFIIISLILPLVGCQQSWTGEDCLTVNWFNEGFTDGQRGIVRTLECETRACARNGIEVDFELYKAGLKEGIREYCTPLQGQLLGEAGKPYPCICPPDLAGPFRLAWYQAIKCYYTPELGCGEGCAKTYCSPPIPCGSVTDFPCEVKGCPCIANGS